MADELIRGQVSFSQVSKPCGYQVLMDQLVYAHGRGDHEDGPPMRLCRRCQGLPEPARNISALFGDAFEAGVAWQLQHDCGPDAALEVARQTLRDQVYEAWADRRIERGEEVEVLKSGGVSFNDPPDIRNDGKPWANQVHKMPTLLEAERNLELGVSAWVNQFGRMRATAFQREAIIPLAGEFEGWRIKCKLDFLTEEAPGERGFVDTKASGSQSWSKQDLDDKLDQLHIYHLAHEVLTGARASYGFFHLLHTGTDRLEVIEVPYDAEAIHAVLEDVVYPFIRAKEAGHFYPNKRGWWHSERYCDHWEVCPHGGRARGRFLRVEFAA